ncbi:DUF4153 domain-containing protein [Paenibacillus hexagrammi]|uniref:DUF4173 domain-containing protein n=1 Tax=Paenibacillus hexagrammi TaxID=2908839 RepID=A0ABY3SM60_9BACL|nr:DUF4173 domain-containing protein [Paenibacillus sp. YPD9-1]UJF34047.1 DUF4173 domain-containing protein [Paenibacillus sp. YPD9-1]
MRDPAPWQKRYGRLLLLSILFGVVSQYLFIDKMPGISVVVTVAGFYGIYAYAIRGRLGGFDKWRGQSLASWALLPVIALLALTYVLYDNRLFAFLNLFALLLLVLGQTVIMTRTSTNPWYRWPFLQELVSQSVAKPLRYLNVPFRMIKELFPSGNGKHSERESNWGKIRQGLLGLLLALPILFVVVALLASADSIFQSWVSEVPQWLSGISIGDGIARIAAGSFIALYTFCYIWGLLFPLIKERADAALEYSASDADPVINLSMSPITAAVLLVSVNSVYVLFAAIQFSYLFGAADGMLPTGVAYAEYARRGFAELVLVALINIVLLLGGLRLIEAGGRAAELLRKLLLSMLVGCTLVMLVSAYSRLSLYEHAYGYTQSRLLVHGFMLYLAVLLLIALCRIWKERFSLAKATVCISVAAYLIMNYANIDARIALNNIQRFEETGVIDIPYLSRLSVDALPAIAELQSRHPELLTLQPVLKRMRTASSDEHTWASWNLSRWKAHR